jgi:hypothetical protein
MTKPDKSKILGAAEKLMVHLMEKHPGASESSLLALFPKCRKGKTRGVASNRWPFYEAQLGPIVSCDCQVALGRAQHNCVNRHRLCQSNFQERTSAIRPRRR